MRVRALLVAFSMVVGAACAPSSSRADPGTDSGDRQLKPPDVGSATTGSTETGTATASGDDGFLQPAGQPSLTARIEQASHPATLEDALDLVETEGLFRGVIAVRQGDQIITRGYGLADRERGLANDAETIFDIGSITKQFTGAAVLRLQMDGLLAVDDPISQYLPGLPDDKASITVHQLLTHTAGLPAALGDDDDPIGAVTYLEQAAASPLLFEPGSAFAYSNTGYSLLGLIIERVSGRPYEDYLREALFLPAGMVDTGYVLPDWTDDVIAVGYRNTSQVFGRPNEQVWGGDGPHWHLKANGGVLSSAEDMLRWDAALHGDTILDERAKHLLFGRHVEEGQGLGSFYGYGWSVLSTSQGNTVITHNGGNGVFFADFYRLVDDDAAVFIATNSDRRGVSEIGHWLASFLENEGEQSPGLYTQASEGEGYDPSPFTVPKVYAPVDFLP